MAATPESGYSVVPESIFIEIDKSADSAKVACDTAKEEYMVEKLLEEEQRQKRLHYAKLAEDLKKDSWKYDDVYNNILQGKHDH